MIKFRLKHVVFENFGRNLTCPQFNRTHEFNIPANSYYYGVLSEILHSGGNLEFHEQKCNMDSVISQAQTTLSALVLQHSTFGGINSKLSNIVSLLPTVNNLLVELHK